MLVVPQLSARAQNSAQLCERLALVRNRAKDERNDASVAGGFIDRQPVRRTVDDAHLNRGARSCFLGQRAEISLRLNGDDVLDFQRVMREVQPVSSADFDYSPPQAGEQASTVA